MDKGDQKSATLERRSLRDSTTISAINMESRNDEVSLKELILKLIGWYRYLLGKWVIILFVGVLGGSIGILYSLLKEPIYTATTTFVLESGDGGGGLGQYAGIASMVGIDVAGGGGGIFQGDNIIELYKSRRMIQKTLLSEIDINGNKQLLIDRYIEFNMLRKKWDKRADLKDIQFVGEPNIKFTRIQDSIVGAIVKDIKLNNLTVSKPDKKLSVIKVEVTSKDESFAKNFNEKIVSNVNEFYVQTKTKKSLENVGILQRKTDSVRAVLNGDIYNAAIISDATPNLNVTRQVQRAAPMQRSQFSAEINKAILAELVKNLEMSKMSLHKETPLIQVVDKPVLPLDSESLGNFQGLILGSLIAVFFTIIILVINRIINGILG